MGEFEQINIKITENEKKKFNRIAKSLNMSLTETIKRAMVFYGLVGKEIESEVSKIKDKPYEIVAKQFNKIMRS